jgi:TolA-binding protein
MATKVTAITVRMNEVDQHNSELVRIQQADKSALEALNERYTQAMGELDHLRTRLSDAEMQLDRAR